MFEMMPEKRIKNRREDGLLISIAGKNVPNRGSWRILKPNIDLEKCIKCGLCWLYCPDAAMRLNKNNLPCPDVLTCKGCGVCGDVCPVKCIKMERDMHRENKK